MRVLICAYDGQGYVGGPLVWLTRLAPQLRVAGVDVRFLFFTDHAPEMCSTVQRLIGEGFPCAARRWHSFTQFGDNTEDRVRWILREVRRDPPDVFVANLVTPALYAGRWIREAGIPTVGVCHSDHPFYAALLDQFVCGTDAYRLSAIVCVSALLEEMVRARAGRAVRTARISCGAPVPAQPNEAFRDVMRIAYVGRLIDEAKRATDVARAFCRVVRDVPGVEAVLYGDGPAAPQITALIAEAGLGASVRLAGQVASDRIQAELRHAHAIACLSDYEGLPISLLEGMACGVVPIGLRIRSGIPELVEDGVTGLLVDDRDVAFTSAVQRLRRDPALWQRLSRGARERVQSGYALDIVADQWKALLGDLALGGGGQPRPVKVPRTIRLPAPHPALTADDRKAPFLAYVNAQGRRAMRHVRRLAGRGRS